MPKRPMPRWPSSISNRCIACRGVPNDTTNRDFSATTVTLRVRSNAPSSFLTILWHDDEPCATVRDEVDITRTIDAPAIYRAAVVSPPELGSIPWIISNPRYVGVTFPVASPGGSAVSGSKPIFDGRTAKGWRTEADSTSLAALDVPATIAGSELRMRYGLSSGAPSHQYASLAVELPEIAAP